MQILLLLCVIGAAVQHCTAVPLVRCCVAHELLCGAWAAERHMSCWEGHMTCCVAHEPLCSISRYQDFRLGGTHGSVRNCPGDKTCKTEESERSPTMGHGLYRLLLFSWLSSSPWVSHTKNPLPSRVLCLGLCLAEIKKIGLLSSCIL